MKKTLGIIGVGAFGTLMVRHLVPYFHLCLHDKNRDLSGLAETYNLTIGTLEDAARCDIVVLAVQVAALQGVLEDIAPYLRPEQLVMDVASVKVVPAQIMQSSLPDGVDIVCLHPLFGPKSAKDGISGLNISVCEVRGGKAAHVAHFLRDRLALNVIETTPDQHDMEMAYSQALTHIIARAVVSLDVPEIRQSTKTYGLLKEMIDTISHDSDELFRTIQKFNPYAHGTKEAFFAAVRRIEDSLNEKG